MRRVLQIAETAEGASDAVALDLEGRRRRRHVVRTRCGEEVLIDLAEAPSLKAGQGLRLEDGAVLEVEALPEPVVEIRGSDLVKFAWHLGNRHLPTEIRENALRIRPDHVVEAMLEGLGAELHHIEAAFEPESGAYGQHQHHHYGDQHHSHHQGHG
jgi:urease accessory protein